MFAGGYLGIYNETDEDFIIGEIKMSGLDLKKMKVNMWYGAHFENCIENTNFLGEVVPAKGFLVIGYGYNYKNESPTILVELISEYKKRKYRVDIFFSEEKVTYLGSYKITYRFAGMGDCSIIPDRFFSHLCDMLVIISDQTSIEHSSNCKIF